MSTITRSGFANRYHGQKLELNDEARRSLEAAGMEGSRLETADLDGDGAIQGTSELNALFRQVDHYDRNGRLSSIALTHGSGEATDAGKIVGALDLLFQSTSTVPSGSLELLSTVGPGRSNREADVRAVQQRLKDLGFDIDVDGAFGRQTRGALKVYEAMVRGSDDVDRLSGSIRPGSTLHEVLSSPDAPRWVPIPRDGVGFENDDWDGFGYGSESLVEVIENAGRRYQENYRAQNPDATRILLNDASRRNGGENRDHATHENGLDMDLRLPTTTGGGGATIFSPNYDRDATFAMVEAFAQDPNVERILQSDPQIVRMARGKPWAHKLQHGGRQHRNHLHIDVKPPPSAFQS